MENVDILYGHLEYFTAIWHIVWPFGKVVVIWYIFPVLVYCINKNLASLEYYYLMFVWFKVIN
jgi:hypothetical protein